MQSNKRKMSVIDFMPTIKGIFIAVIGWTIASIQSFTSFLQVLSASEIEMWDAWISLAIKSVTLITGIILLFYNLNKIIKQSKKAMQIPGDGSSGGDNEDGSAGTGPEED